MEPLQAAAHQHAAHRMRSMSNLNIFCTGHNNFIQVTRFNEQQGIFNRVKKTLRKMLKLRIALGRFGNYLIKIEHNCCPYAPLLMWST